MKHPSLQACQQHIKKNNEDNDAKDEGLQDEEKVQKKQSIASYIKSFTRWMNSWIYAMFSHVSEGLRSVVKVLLSYTVGMVLAMTGQQKVRFYIFISMLSSQHDLVSPAV